VPSLVDSPTHARARAAENFADNLRVLRQTQPHLVDAVPEIEPDVEWLYGRDGSLTARDAHGRWLAGCSLPRRAAREMLRKLDVHGSVACFLAPPHAALLSVALELMRPEQAVVALVREIDELRAMLGCENFAAAIAAHRLWFVAGESWAAHLAKLYALRVGLAPPAQFIRVPASSDELIETLVNEAQQVISQISLHRSERVQSLRAQPWRRAGRAGLCVVAPTRFRLWNDLGHAMIGAAREAADAGDDFTWTLYDADDPACGSPLALAETSRQCGALLTANTARCDLPGLLPDEMPWVTWVTGTRIPSAGGAAPNDRLLLADPGAFERALKHGWRTSHVHVATWQVCPIAAGGFATGGARDCETASGDPDRSSGDAHLIIADTRPLDAPEDLNDYSSHLLLWESIRDELLRDPRAVEADVGTYLASRMRKLHISPDGFPTNRFIEHLTVPAYQQGVARALLRERRGDVRIHGENWDRIAEFAPHAHGIVTSREHFAGLLTSSRVLVHVWPTRHAHPIDFTDRPVLRLGSATAAPPRLTAPPLSGEILRNILLGS